MITQTEEQIAASTDPPTVSLLTLRKTALEKRKAQVEAARDSDFLVDAWCVDLTEGLSGEVGTIEIGTETAHGTNIRPGYGDGAAYSSARDGFHTPTLTMDLASFMQNFAMFPAVQKWKPTYRYGTISNINTDTDTCTVTLDALYSSVDGLDINHVLNLTNVPIDYMDCNALAFEDGDQVVVKWTPYNAGGSPSVIGFKSSPKPCEVCTYMTIRTYRTGPAGEDDEKCYIVWDMIENRYAQSPLFADDNWPKSWNEIADFMSGMDEEESNGDVYTLYRPRGVYEIEMPEDPIVIDCADPGAPNAGYQVNEVLSQWETEGYRQQIYRAEVCDDPVEECVYWHDAVCRTTEEYELIEAYNIIADDDIRVWSGDFEAPDGASWSDSVYRTEWRKDKEGWSQCIDRGGWCQIKAETEHDTNMTWHTPIGDLEINIEYHFWEYDYINYTDFDPLLEKSKNLIHMYQPFVTVQTDTAVVQIYPFVSDWDYKEWERDPDNLSAEAEITVEETGSTVEVLASYEIFPGGVEGQNPADMIPNVDFAEAVKDLIETRIADGQFRVDQYHLYARIWHG
jgi:hypothetical protein